MARRPLGIETEYGLSLMSAGKPGRDDMRIHDRLMSEAMKRFSHLPAGRGNGLFLGNGARFYIDCGGHPEYCTPEVENPRDVVRYADAGAEFLQDLVSKSVRETGGTGEVLLFRCNVDYLTAATWACHENYGHRASPLLLPSQVIPHLVSRIIYTGAGGLNPCSQGIEFCLSPRVFHLIQATSSSSTGKRGIYHFRDESLSGPGWSRLHVLSGDSLCSQLGTWLKVGTTALIVALVEGGLKPAHGIELLNPVQAMRRFNCDVTLSSTVELRDGRQMTALDLQRHYLGFVREHLGNPCLPDWAEELCSAWHEMLERLARGPAHVSTRIDWGIKYALFHEHLGSRGVTPDELAAFNNALPRQSEENTDRPADSASESGQKAATGDDPFCTARQKHFRQVRMELCELDVRFGRIGPSGIFAALDRTNLLHHRLDGLTPARVREAMCEPPRSGRARLRGKTVQKFNGSSVHVCDWDSVWTRDETETLNLSDPLLEEMPTWTRNAPPSPTSNGSDCDPILDRVADEYQCGRYELAYACLREFTRANLQPGSSARMRYSGLMALVLSRRGFFPDAMAIMGTRGRQDWNSFSTVCEGVAIQRFKSLVPGEGIWELARRGDALAEQSALEAQDWVFSLQAHKGCALLHAGRLDDARTVLVQSLADSPLESSQAQMFALATADLAEIYRRLGEPALARNCLDEAERIQTGGGFFGDLTDFTMLTRAKLESVDGDVSGLLARAESIQIQNTNRMGLVRTLILKARLLHDAASANANKERILQIQQQLPSLQECPVCERILEGWDDWCAGKPPLAGQDQFWGM